MVTLFDVVLIGVILALLAWKTRGGGDVEAWRRPVLQAPPTLFLLARQAKAKLQRDR